MNAIDFLFIPLIVLSAHLIINNLVQKHALDTSERRLLIKLFYYHLFFSLVFGWYVTVFGGDSVGYWRHPGRFWKEDEYLGLHVTGTPFVFFLTYPFSQVLGMSFWAGCVLFSLFGFMGVVFIFLLSRRIFNFNPTIFGFKLFPLVLFLPNMHFWSGGIGKDSVVFFALCMFVYSMTDLKGNVFKIIISFYLAYFLRPHIALVMLVGFAMALLVSSRGVSAVWRVAFLGISIAAFVVIAPAVFDFIGVDAESLDNYENISNVRSKNLSRSTTGSAIQISEYPVPLKLFTFFFRPLFFDAGNVFGLVVSFENLFYLVLTLSAFRPRSFLVLYRMPILIKACLIISLATAFFLSSSLGNLGIVIRQKNMVMFMFLLVVMFLIHEFQKGNKTLAKT